MEIATLIEMCAVMTVSGQAGGASDSPTDERNDHLDHVSEVDRQLQVQWPKKSMPPYRRTPSDHFISNGKCGLMVQPG